MAEVEKPIVEEKPIVDQENNQQTEQKQEPQERTYTEVEQRALDQGWKPLEDWDGDPEDHRSAKAYIDRGELLGKIKDQSREMREMKQVLSNLSEHNKNVYVAGYEKAIKELKLQRVEAIKEGDGDSLLRIEEQLDSNKDALATVKAAPTVKATTNETSPAFDAWLEQNRWYENDEDMHDWADGAAMRMGQKAKQERRQMSESEVYSELTKRAKERFPDKFKRTAAQSPDGDGRRATTKTSPKGGDRFEQLLAEMPEEMAAAAKSLVKSGVLTKEKYVEDFDAIGGR